MKFSRRKLLFTAIIVLLILSPFALLLNPVLQKFQERNTKMHDRLIKKMNQEKEVSEQWSNLKFRQKILGHVYRYTFRDQKAISAYEKYLDWFEDDWKTMEYVRLKYETASLCRTLAQQDSSLREYKKKAACHYHEIVNWYEGVEGGFEDFRRKSRKAISSFDLRRFTNNCG